jgi:ketosteroid isomerase-like protein
MAEVPAAIRRYFDGLNNEDWEDFAGIWTEDAELLGVGARPRKGREDVITYYSTVLEPYPVHRDDPYAIHVCGDVVTVEIAFAGETREGVPVEFEAVDVFTLRDGRIRRLTTWYDVDRVRKLITRPGPPERRLRTLVAAAAADSPFYRRRFRELGLEPEQVAADLSLLPPTREADLAGAELRAVPPERVGQVVAFDRVVLPLTAADVDEADRVLADALALAGVTRADLVMPLVPHRGLGAAAARLGVRVLVPGTPDTVGAAAAGGATVLFAPASADVPAFRARSSERGADLGGVRLVVGTAADAAGWPHARLYGTPPTGVVAGACTERAGLHVFDAHVVEIVGADGSPARPGAPGELLVTPLGRRAAPLLRLATGARASLVDGPCACGSPLPRIELAP